MRTTHSSPTNEAIAARAYSLWEEAGRPTGRDMEFWLRAEQELLAASSAEAPTSGTPVPAARKPARTPAERRKKLVAP